MQSYALLTWPQGLGCYAINILLSRSVTRPTRHDNSKGTSFLGRFRGNKKKDSQDQTLNGNGEEEGGRLEGADAQVFYQPVNNMGYRPRHPPPPAYIKVRSRNKKQTEFQRVFLAQELCHKRLFENEHKNAHTHNAEEASEGKAVWATEFSKDGKYLATTGNDRLVRIWTVLSSRQERRVHEKQEVARENITHANVRLSAPVFRDDPLRVYEGYTRPVLDLSWSKVRTSFASN